MRNREQRTRLALESDVDPCGALHNLITLHVTTLFDLFVILGARECLVDISGDSNCGGDGKG